MDPEAAEIEAAEVERKRVAAFVRANYVHSMNDVSARARGELPKLKQFPTVLFQLTRQEIRAEACKSSILAGKGCCGACCNNTRSCHCAGLMPCLDCKGGVCPGCE